MRFFIILGGGNKTNSLMISDSEDVKAVHIPEGRPSMDTASIIGLIIWFACVLYSSIRSSSNAQAARYFYIDKYLSLSLLMSFFLG